MKKTEESVIEKLREIFVSIDVFNLRMTPIEKIVYGAAYAVGLAVIGAILALVFKSR